MFYNNGRILGLHIRYDTASIIQDMKTRNNVFYNNFYTLKASVSFIFEVLILTNSDQLSYVYLYLYPTTDIVLYYMISSRSILSY